MPKRVVIVAANARPYARAADAAGIEVIAVDVFNDEDLRRFAFHTIRLGYRHGGFDAGEVREKLFPWLQAPDTTFLYGSGFEAQPELLQAIAARVSLSGNPAHVVCRVKDPTDFFNTLACLRIPHPETTCVAPSEVSGWLVKAVGGSGGTHIRVDGVTEGDHVYFQRVIPGVPYGLLFLANGQEVSPIGYHRQWLAPTHATPYRYGGVIRDENLPKPVKSSMLEAARELTRAYGLVGLNSLDVMVNGDAWWVLEINPRLSASFMLYDQANQGRDLLRAHLAACAGRLTPWQSPDPVVACKILYASRSVMIPDGVEWPVWAVDRPVANAGIVADAPVCSMMADGADTEAVCRLLAARECELNQLLSIFVEPTL